MSRYHFQSFVCLILVQFSAFYSTSQLLPKKSFSTPCESGFIRNADTLILHIDDVGIRPVKRRIQMIHTKGNWFRVQYDDSKGAIALRKIHRQRIKKFFKLYQTLKDDKISTNETEVMNLTIDSSVCSEIAPVYMEQLKTLERMKRVLKIWK